MSTEITSIEKLRHIPIDIYPVYFIVSLFATAVVTPLLAFKNSISLVIQPVENWTRLSYTQITYQVTLEAVNP